MFRNNGVCSQNMLWLVLLFLYCHCCCRFDCHYFYLYYYYYCYYYYYTRIIPLFYPYFNVIVVIILPIFIIKVEPYATCTMKELLPCSIETDYLIYDFKNESYTKK